MSHATTREAFPNDLLAGNREKACPTQVVEVEMRITATLHGSSEDPAHRRRSLKRMTSSRRLNSGSVVGPERGAQRVLPLGQSMLV